MYTIKNNRDKIFIDFNETQAFKSLVKLWSGEDTLLQLIQAQCLDRLYYIRQNIILLNRTKNMTTTRARRKFTDEFKNQMYQLYISGKLRADIVREYDLTPSALDRWIAQAQTTGSFKENDNWTPEEVELIKLRKELQQLRMENDILKQTALIMGRK